MEILGIIVNGLGSVMIPVIIWYLARAEKLRKENREIYETLSNNISKLSDKLNVTHANIRIDLEDLSKELKSDYEVKIAKVDSKVDLNERRVNNLELKTATHGVEMENMNKDLAELKQSFKELALKIDKHFDKVFGLFNSLKDNR